MRQTIFLFFLALSLGAYAQKVPNPKPFAKTITEEDLRTHLFIVAGEEMQGRETATEGQRKAASYIEDQFRKFGLKPGNGDSYQLHYPVYKDESEKNLIEIKGREINDPALVQPLSSVNHTADLYFSEFIFAGHGISDESQDDYKDLNVAGKLVVVLDGAPAGYKSSVTGFRSPTAMYGKLMVAQQKGAAALLIVYPKMPPNRMRGGGMYTSLYKASISPNAFLVSEEIASTLMGTDFKSIKAASKEKALDSKTFETDVHLSVEKTVTKEQSSNVLGVIEGSDLKDEYLFITAHYDHLGTRNDSIIYYGADDDGSGTVGVLELAEAFAKAKADGKGPRRSIVFMTVSGEEKGLWGSEYYSDHPVFPLDKTTADLNIDMIGRTDATRKSGDSSNYVYVVGDDKLSSDLRKISESVNKKYVKMELDYKYNDPEDKNRIYYRSDHYNFARKGVPIIFYYDGMLGADYHKPTDTADKINYPLLKKRTLLVFYTAWEMANRAEMVVRDIPLN